MGPLILLGEGFVGNLFLVYFVNALPMIAWRPSGTALTLRVRPNTIYKTRGPNLGPLVLLGRKDYTFL